ncbi:uncharacterized protein LOC122071563 [Macadamia integrifolia]|uniref:uncharacterized protein LOC122071563 n=1 Tax=Macadamia integrifolia TaxID=60698 RepID=UPI001C4E585F|nr:uncharacterized protein LOC122071563 [Macadamia integrifolia]
MAEKFESFEFAHVKGELRSSRFTTKNCKYNGQVSKSLSGGTSKSGTKSRFPLHVTAMAAAPSPPLKKESTIEPKQGERNNVVDWSPVDDGIKIVIPSSSSSSTDESETREKIDSYINYVLYGLRE